MVHTRNLFNICICLHVFKFNVYSSICKEYSTVQCNVFAVAGLRHYDAVAAADWLCQRYLWTLCITLFEWSWDLQNGCSTKSSRYRILERTVSIRSAGSCSRFHSVECLIENININNSHRQWNFPITTLLLNYFTTYHRVFVYFSQWTSSLLVLITKRINPDCIL
jgi:hypothetical protein